MGRVLVLLVILSIAGAATNSSGAFRKHAHQDRNDGGYLLAASALAQHAGHTPGAAAATLSLAIDGELTPSAIPDDRAYAHFMEAIAKVGDNSTIRDAALKQVGLSAEDRTALLAATRDLNIQLKQIEESKSGLSFDIAKQRRQAAFQTAQTQVQAKLSFEGWSRLQDYIDRQVKRRIKIYRGTISSTSTELQK